MADTVALFFLGTWAVSSSLLLVERVVLGAMVVVDGLLRRGSEIFGSIDVVGRTARAPRSVNLDAMEQFASVPSLMGGNQYYLKHYPLGPFKIP